MCTASNRTMCSVGRFIRLSQQHSVVEQAFKIIIVFFSLSSASLFSLALAAAHILPQQRLLLVLLADYLSCQHRTIAEHSLLHCLVASRCRIHSHLLRSLSLSCFRSACLSTCSSHCCSSTKHADYCLRTTVLLSLHCHYCSACVCFAVSIAVSLVFANSGRVPFLSSLPTP